MTTPAVVRTTFRKWDAATNKLGPPEARDVTLICNADVNGKPCGSTSFQVEYTGTSWYYISVEADTGIPWDQRYCQGDVETGDFDVNDRWTCKDCGADVHPDLDAALYRYEELTSLAQESAARIMAQDLARDAELQAEEADHG